jgi:ABC-type Mn2+/Zn2+ transport system ATPase subunit
MMGPDSAVPGILEARSLEVRLGGRTVVGPLSFRWEAGSWHLVTGDNGAGKTTLLRALAGLIPLQAGEVQVGPFRLAPGVRASPRVAYLPQVLPPGDLPISVAEVASLGRLGRPRVGADRAGVNRATEVAEALVRTGLGGMGRASYGDLSGGERQRVHLARCLVHGSHFLFLDEPAASLDPEAKDAMLDLVEALATERGLTVVMVSHETRHFTRPGWHRHPMLGGCFDD